MTAACVLVALAAGLVSAVPASARRHLAATFHLRGSHGYGIQVVAHRAGLPLGTTKADRHVGKLTVIARKGSESASHVERVSTSYTVPAKFNKHRIRADLGRFGHVRLRFHKRPHFLFPPRPAAAKDPRIGVCGQFGLGAPGEFRGAVRFHGEGGYTSARTHRVRGQVSRYTPVRCSGRDHGVALEARSGSTRFAAFQDDDFGVTFLSARTRERSGRVAIVREAGRLIRADAGEFTFDPELTEAHVAPGGAQFTGTADYASPDSWTGPLAVSFPGGDAGVPLTGSAFDVTLQRTRVPKAVSRLAQR